ncbi:RHS repeat protein [Rodentibacter caecimuris]|nr:RHS repeat protein [Pasteurella caecimuris]
MPREMTDSQGKLIWRGRYDAWGGLHYDRHLAQQNQGHQPFRLQNQYVDQETGLHYNFQRYYEPITGRFISQDPIGLAGGNNLYRFAPNVQAWVDPLGLTSNYTDQFGDYYGASAAMAERGSALDILSSTIKDMLQFNLAGTDQFFHCTAFCRVSKSNVVDKKLALTYGKLKEMLDFSSYLFGKYGEDKLTISEMINDMNEDIDVNEYGFKCPTEHTCSQRCEKYINSNHLKTKKILKDKGYL